MPTRPVIAAPKFGQWLQLQRGQRSLEQIALKVRPLVQAAGLKVDQSLIYKIEQGRVPSWPMLAALCRVYDTAIGDGLSVLVSAIEFPGSRDLLRQERDQASDFPQGGNADDPASAASIGLQSALERRHAAAVAAMQDVIKKLADTLAAEGVQAHRQDANTRKNKPRPRTGGRKVG